MYKHQDVYDFLCINIHLSQHVFSLALTINKNMMNLTHDFVLNIGLYIVNAQAKIVNKSSFSCPTLHIAS